MRARHYDILSEKVEAGVMRGVNRAFKHDDEPDRNAIVQAVVDAVMAAICEAYEFDEDSG